MKEIFLEGRSIGSQKIAYYQYKKKDKKVKGLVLLAPADDYNVRKRELGRKFQNAVKLANKLYKKDKNTEMPQKYSGLNFSISRFLSFADLRFVEARLFNYESQKLKEFSKIKTPILAIFGSKDDSLVKSAKKYMEILERDTNSKSFNWFVVKNADHGFTGKEDQTAKIVVDWLERLKR